MDMATVGMALFRPVGRILFGDQSFLYHVQPPTTWLLLYDANESTGGLFEESRYYGLGFFWSNSVSVGEESVRKRYVESIQRYTCDNCGMTTDDVIKHAQSLEAEIKEFQGDRNEFACKLFLTKVLKLDWDNCETTSGNVYVIKINWNK